MNQNPPINWASTYKRLTLYTYKRLLYFGVSDIDTAQDMAGEAIRRFYDEDYANWHVQETSELLSFLGSIVNGLLHNWFRRHKTHREYLMPHDQPNALSLAHDDGFDPEMRLEKKQLFVDVLNNLRKKIEGDTLMESMLDLWLQGYDKPKEMADMLQVSMKDIYNANRRFKTHYLAIRNLHERRAQHDLTSITLTSSR